MALNDRLVAFAQAVGVDIGELIITRGNLTTLNTVAKNNLVAAINEIKAGIASIDLTALINDAATTGDLTSVYSADKLVALFDQLKNEILNDAPDSFNTLKEISDYLAANDQNINNLLDLINKTVRYDAAQTLQGSEQYQACINIGVGYEEVDLAGIFSNTVSGIVVPPAPPLTNITWNVSDPFGHFILRVEGMFQHDTPLKAPDVSDYPAYVDVAPNTTLTVTVISVEPGFDVTLSDYWIAPLQDTGTLAAMDQAGNPLVVGTPYTVIVGNVPGAEGAIGFGWNTDVSYLRVRAVL